MKIFGCLKNFGSVACLLASSGLSIWTWHYVTSPKTVGEVYEGKNFVLLKENFFIKRFADLKKKQAVKGDAKVRWNKCLIIHTTSFHLLKDENQYFYEEECIEKNNGT